MEFRSARSEGEILAWLAELGDEACLVAGGTDVMMQYARSELSPRAFVHIEAVRALATTRHDGLSRLGALSTHRRLARDPEVRRRNPALAEAAATVGGWQTQSVGTLAGNICNASPAADTAPPLLVADAVVELAGAHGMRRVPLAQFFVGRRRVDRRPDELVTAIEVVPLAEHESEVYVKVGRRSAMVVAVVGLAARLGFDETGSVRAARLALCSVAPTPFRATEAEHVLGEGGDSPAGLEAVSEALLRVVAPIDDTRSSERYRTMVLGGLLERAVQLCRERALGGREEQGDGGC